MVVAHLTSDTGALVVIGLGVLALVGAILLWIAWRRRDRH